MVRDNNRKIKLLKLCEMLQQETDEQNPMMTGAIIKRLEASGTSCERRTSAKDIGDRNSVEIRTEQGKKANIA